MYGRESTSFDRPAVAGCCKPNVRPLRRFWHDLTGVPSELFVGGGDVRNLEVMSHPFWQPLRERAAQLLRELEPATKECRRFLNMKDELT